MEVAHHRAPSRVTRSRGRGFDSRRLHQTVWLSRKRDRRPRRAGHASQAVCLASCIGPWGAPARRHVSGGVRCLLRIFYVSEISAPPDALGGTGAGRLFVPRKERVMATETLTGYERLPADATVSKVEIPQYRTRAILAIWAAAALPMAALAWLVAPALKDRFAGAGNVPMVKALLLCLTVGLIWEFVLLVALLWREQGTLRWSTTREALWLRSPRSPRSGRVGGRVWLVLIPL